MTIKPFRFRLKKISSRQQALLDAMMSFLPKTGLRVRLHRAIEEALAKHIGRPVTYALEAVSEMSHQAFVRQLPGMPIIAVMSCVPVERKAYLQIDNVLAQGIIGHLLGGPDDDIPIPRALTDTEQGILQYVLLQLMAHVYRLSGQAARVHFRFDRFAFEPDVLTGLCGADEQVTVLTLRMQGTALTGFVRLVLPDPLVEANFLNVEGTGELREDEAACERAELSRFADFKVRMWAEAGRTTLKPAELGQIERDDVILFDESDIVLGDNRELGGRVLVRVGAGGHGGFTAKITSDSRRVRCRLEEQVKGEHI